MYPVQWTTTYWGSPSFAVPKPFLRLREKKISPLNIQMIKLHYYFMYAYYPSSSLDKQKKPK